MIMKIYFFSFHGNFFSQFLIYLISYNSLIFFADYLSKRNVYLSFLNQHIHIFLFLQLRFTHYFNYCYYKYKNLSLFNLFILNLYKYFFNKNLLTKKKKKKHKNRTHNKCIKCNYGDSFVLTDVVIQT